MRKVRNILCWITLFSGLGVAGTALAATGCYNLDMYPAVYGLTDSDGKIAGTLRRFDKPGWMMPYSNLQVIRQRDGTWTLEIPDGVAEQYSVYPEISEQCHAAVPTPVLTLKEMQVLSPKWAQGIDPQDPTGVEQKVGDCVEQNGIIWFGITYYCGEGQCGLGGIGRYDTKSGKIEIRRPTMLLNVETSPLAIDGNDIWVGTFMSYECIGDTPVVGLVRYNWATGESVSFGGGTDSRHDPNGPCGFRFNDLYFDKNGLWASSDMGLAYLENPNAAPEAMQWTNWVPQPEDLKVPMREITCPGLYATLMRTLPRKDWNGAADYRGHLDQFKHYLQEFNPKLLGKRANKK